MALKNINVFEQHVEKIVLAVAAAGAIFMGYLATQKITLTNNPDVGPKDVESSVSAAIQQLDAGRQKRENEPDPQPSIPDFIGSYNSVAGGQPLDKALLSSAMPDFGPHNLQPQLIQGPTEESVASVVPAPPAPELVHAEALQLQVCVNPPADPTTGVPSAPGVLVTVPADRQLVTVTKNVVAIDGYIPVGKFALDMIKEQDSKKRFTPDVQRGLVYRVHVFRRELLPNGSWSKPEPVTPAKGAAAPAELLTTTMADGDLPARMNDIDAQFQLIQLPPYYVDANGQPVQPPIIARPLPQAIADETAKLHNDIQSAQLGTVPGGFRPIAPTPVPGATTAPGPTTLPSTPDQIKTLEVQPFAFWDDSVKSDHSYKYSLQVQVVNPGFGWKWGLAKKDLKLVPVLPPDNDGIVDVPGIIVVHSDLAFFIRGTELSSNRIGGQIFKQVNGRWYSTSFSVDKGMDIQAPMNTGGAESETVDTKFAIVDYQDSNRNVHVILKDPTGNLVTRDSSDDWSRPERTDLSGKVESGRAAAATAPAVDAAGNPITATPTVTPVTGRGPTSVTPRTPTTVPTTPTPARNPGVGPPVH